MRTESVLGVVRGAPAADTLFSNVGNDISLKATGPERWGACGKTPSRSKAKRYLAVTARISPATAQIPFNEDVMFKVPSFSVKARLIGNAGVLLIMLLISARVGLNGMSLADENIGRLYEDNLVPFSLVDEIARGSLSNFAILGEATYQIGDKAFVARQLEGVTNRIQTVDGLVKKLQAYQFNPAVKEQIDAFIVSRGDFLASAAKVSKALTDGNADARQLLYSEALPATTAMQSEIAKLIQLQLADGNRMYQQVRQDHARMSKMTMAGLVIAFALGLLMTFLTIRAIVSSLRRAVIVADEISTGHLGHEIITDGKHELGQLLNSLRTMDGRLAGIVSEVRHGAQSVSVAARQISNGNNDLSQRTQEQASGLEETASAMEEMTSIVRQNADSAGQASQMALSAREQAEQGGQVAEQAARAMREIDESSHKIADIIGLIDEIAFQTNLLSLNAAVEAARAGEHGRGFAVVATEVRNLAQRCATAAKDIKGLINDSREKVRSGSELVQKAGSALVEIINGVKGVAVVIGEIAAASQEQSAGIDQVSRAVMQMDEVTQQNAALVEESASAAHALEEQAGVLVQQVAFFQILHSKEVDASPLPAVNNDAETSNNTIATAGRHASAPANIGTPSRMGPAVWKEF